MPEQLYLETSRLILRPFEDRDTEPFARYRNDPEVARYQGWSTPYTMEQAMEFVADMKTAPTVRPGHWFQAAVTLKSTGQLIGDGAIKILGEDIRQAEMGFTLAREFQGQGYAVEAVSRMLDYMFIDLALHRVIANTDPENQNSIHLLQRLGLRHEGRFIQSLWFKGAWADEDWYAILREEWLAKKDGS